jgi:F420-dependent oxidoreductase-like protein
VAFTLGVHAGPQNVSYADLLRLWKVADSGGFGWVSVWDHFYDDPSPERMGTNLEAAAALGALASETNNVRVGALAMCVGYRHPTVLANMAATVDHISGGRFELGLGAGWMEDEYRDYGIPFPGVGVRLDILEEALAIVTGMLTQPATSFAGDHFTVTDAKCEPKPVNSRLPIWVCGGGEKRTLRMAAKYGDGWNVPYVSPDAFQHKVGVLDGWCEREGRDPAAIERTMNAGFYMGVSAGDADAKRRAFDAAFGERATTQGPGMLFGTSAQVIDRIGEYSDAGAQGINIALRAPFDWDAISAFQEEVIPAFTRA